MESLLNPDVIKAAASSTLGILSLMCLIMGVVALAFFRNSPVWARLFVFILLLIGLSGFGSAVLRQQAPKAPSVEASREFVVGRWQVEQTIAGLEGGSFVDYEQDGRFTGKTEMFVNGDGKRLPVAGTWDFTKRGKDEFGIALNFDDGQRWDGTFRIVARDRIHNIKENYDAVRVAR